MLNLHVFSKARICEGQADLPFRTISPDILPGSQKFHGQHLFLELWF